MSTRDDIERALAEATPGRWYTADDGWSVRVRREGRMTTDAPVTRECVQGPRDAHLIANAPTWLRWQQERIAALEAALRTIALHHLRGTDTCEMGHRKGEAGAHVHHERLHEMGRAALAALEDRR